MKKIMLVFGTRPEAIKMSPLAKRLAREESFEVEVAVTAQHREILDQVLDIFGIIPDYDLNIMKAGQSLEQITSRVLSGVGGILDKASPDLVLVHGDTTTTFAASLAAFYRKIPVGHVEAGLRSGDIYSPFPEEMNRKLTGSIASLHFAPTETALGNLLAEGVAREKIHVTGNTVIDALLEVVERTRGESFECLSDIPFRSGEKVILVTAHRRENWGEPMRNVFHAIRDIHDAFPGTRMIFPVHPNPLVREPAEEILGGLSRVHLTAPMEYLPFSALMDMSDIVLTDSGGIQEEAPALGKPVLVLRQNTERPEAVEAGTVLLTGTDRETIFKNVKNLLTVKDFYDKMAKAVNPYGDGCASERIAEMLSYFLGITKKVPKEWQYEVKL